jgi:hypothetical protein
LDRSRRVDQDSYVKRPNRSPDEGNMTYTRFAHRVHRSDRCPPVWTEKRFRLVKGFPCGARPLHPINIKGHGRLRDAIDQINLLLYFYFFPLPYTFPIYYLLFLLRLYVDWGRSRWPCRPKSNLTCAVSTGSCPGDVRRSFVGSPRQRSDRWAKVWPVTHTGLTDAYTEVLHRAPLRCCWPDTCANRQ